MDKEIKAEARKQYFRYFRFWFIIAGVALVLFLITGINRLLTPQKVRGNMSSPAERVYDYADVLTEQEEDALRELIAETEEKTHCDLVLVTIEQQVGVNDYEWNVNMRNIADDFYDEKQYGYDKVHGDGVLLLDNWYQGQKGSWLSTCGEAYLELTEYDIDYVLDCVYQEVEDSPYRGYKAYIEEIGYLISDEIGFPMLLMLIPVIVMLIFVFSKLHSPIAADTTGLNEYVMGGSPLIRIKTDALARKFVTKRRIPRSDGSRSRSGGGGSHISSGGVSHGGGGRRR